MKAFPRMSHKDCFGYQHPAEDGMDLRDYFAAKTMQQLIQTYGNHGDYEKCASEAYKFADAMMKARDV